MAGGNEKDSKIYKLDLLNKSHDQASNCSQIDIVLGIPLILIKSTSIDYINVRLYAKKEICLSQPISQ
jgi:hypothetical protein